MRAKQTVEITGYRQNSGGSEWLLGIESRSVVAYVRGEIMILDETADTKRITV